MVIHGGLLNHHWLDFGELLRADVDLRALSTGLLVQLAWIIVAGALAWSRLSTADVTAYARTAACGPFDEGRQHVHRPP